MAQIMELLQGTLQLTTLGTVTGTVPVWIGSLGINQGVTNFTIKTALYKTVLKEQVHPPLPPLVFLSEWLTVVPMAIDNDNVTIQNNHIRRCSYGIQAIGMVRVL